MLFPLRRATATATIALQSRFPFLSHLKLVSTQPNHTIKPLTNPQLKTLVLTHYKHGKFLNLIQNVVASPSVLLTACINLNTTPPTIRPSHSILTYSCLTFSQSSKWLMKSLRIGSILGHVVLRFLLSHARPSKSIWVGGIGPSVLKEDLEAKFLKFGKIENLKFFRDRNTALVDYFTLEYASQALKVMNGARIGDGHIRVDFLRSNPSKS